MNHPLLSICMATYKRLKHIERQIQYFNNELENVDSQEVEIIISNNASPDGTREFLEEASYRYSWLKVNQNETNIGAMNNSNLLLHMAQGTYVWFPGDDDYLKIGLIRDVLQILRKKELSFLFLPSLGIDEQTKKISIEGHLFQLAYNMPIRLAQTDMVRLLKEHFSPLKFQTSSIFLRAHALQWEEEICCFSPDIQANDHTAFFAIRSMQEGVSYFISDISSLSGNEVAWAKERIHFLSVSDLTFVEGLSKFGFSRKDCRVIKRTLQVKAVCCYLQIPELFLQWKTAGFPGWDIACIPGIFMLAVKKLWRKFSISKQYIIHQVSAEDFGVSAETSE